MKQKINVFSIILLEECLKDTCNNADDMSKCERILEDFMMNYEVGKNDIITSLAITIYLDSIRNPSNIRIVNIIKLGIKNVEYKASIDALV